MANADRVKGLVRGDRKFSFKFLLAFLISYAVDYPSTFFLKQFGN